MEHADDVSPASLRSSATLRDEILSCGLDASRARALGDALEREGLLLEAIAALVQANRLRRDAALESRLVRLRHAAFSHLDRSLPPPTWPPAVPDDGPDAQEGPTVVSPDALTPGVLRNGILRHGVVWVRGLVPPARVSRLRDGIDRAFAAFDDAEAGLASGETAAWFDPLHGPHNPGFGRQWRRQGNAVLGTDSPRFFFEFLETVYDLGLDGLLTAFLGERPCLAAEKCTLFRVDAGDWQIRRADWHQDGSFLGDGIRTVNVWFALSRCGRDAPGMELIPVRLDRLLPVGEKGSHFDWTVSPETVARELPGVRPWRPEFEAGDVLFFDHFALHRTAADEGMPNVRYAIESWFFASSVYPEGRSTPLVV